MAANANYQRRRNRPQHPQDLAFELNSGHIPNDNFLRRDVNVDGARHLFGRDLQLDLLEKAKTWEAFEKAFPLLEKITNSKFTKREPWMTDYWSTKFSINQIKIIPKETPKANYA
ncbi:hypothetical protein LSH36_294g02022 [Paralvinella palmiformis]|uniref:Uncharacterized protein n=1 Tax=Paralvinella palmiformis TaxID=53620 RepID=A0AAD9N1B6_9ANNE|nr:hypothetical protein LSH36_294g02022 [Paralvinella palmiformis]